MIILLKHLRQSRIWKSCCQCEHILIMQVVVHNPKHDPWYFKQLMNLLFQETSFNSKVVDNFDGSRFKDINPYYDNTNTNNKFYLMFWINISYQRHLKKNKHKWNGIKNNNKKQNKVTNISHEANLTQLTVNYGIYTI